MRYYSDMLGKLFNDEQDLREAEQKVIQEEKKKKEAENLKKAKRAERAKEVEQALKDANEAQTKAIKLLKAFTKDYGYFHTSYSTKEDKEETVDDFFDVLNTFLY